VRAVAFAAAVVGAAALAVPSASMAAPAAQRYLVLYKQPAVPSDAAASARQAGGQIVAAYEQIGVAVATSSSAGFAAALAKDKRVEGVSTTSGFASRVNDPAGDDGMSAASPAGDLPNAPAGGDPLAPLQWDMRQIKAPEAHAITGGSPDVVVGDIDTGLDYTHPDLAQNVDFSRSVSCVGGVPNQDPAAWKDDHGHGTHTAGTIAAAYNGMGMTGVAPNVKVAGIKAGNSDGYFYPEAVVCAFVWAGTHGIDVTNNSYYVDPYLYNCRNDATQRAVWTAVQRAVRFAMSKGVTVVAAEGNEDDDLSHPSIDRTSPNNVPEPETRAVTNACVTLPVEIPGVVGVTADGHNPQQDDSGRVNYLKSFYSSYGVSTADVVAPGGDSIFGVNAEAPNGRVLSTWPPDVASNCARRVTAPTGDPNAPLALYCYAQGTSMASPHVAGVAALIISRFGKVGGPNGKLPPGRVAAMISQTADPQVCPTALPDGYAEVAMDVGGAGQPPECQGGSGHTSWYGDGQVNALRAVTHAAGK
jgi:subtilisin family serine protease